MGIWKLIDTSGSVRDLNDFYSFRVQFSPGAGMAGVENLSTDFGLLDGAVFQRTRVPTREFQLLGYISASSGSALHIKRKALINAVKPDRSASQVPLVLQYYGASDVVQASVFYNGGMELGQPTPAHELDMGLRFVQFDPYWEATTSTSAALTTSCAIANANRIIQRTANGAWRALDTGLDDTPYAIIESDASVLYAGGDFTTAGGNTASYVAQFTTAGSWVKLGNSFSDTVRGLTIGQDGTLWAGGDFTSACGGTTMNRIAKYNSATSAWSAASTGMNSIVTDLATANSGAIIAAGQFTTAAGTAACSIASWSSSVWSAIASGVGEGTGTANSLLIGVDGAIYVGGGFLVAGTTAASRLAKYPQGASNWSAVGSPLGNSSTAITALAKRSDGTIYAGGNFSTANGGTTAASGIAQFNGTAWFPLSSGVTSTVLAMAYDDDNNLLYVGSFSSGGFSGSDNISAWNGTDWIPVGVDLPGAPTITALYYKNGRLTAGYNTSGTASATALTSISVGGTSTTYPILSCSAPTSTSAKLYQLINYTTNDQIYFNLTLSAGEVVTLDLRPGQKTFTSNFRGNIISSILPSSNLATFRLLPGTNNISFFMTSGSGAAKLTWYSRYWGVDS